MYAPKSKWTISFLGISVVQSSIVLSFEFLIFAWLQQDIVEIRAHQSIGRAIPTFLSLYTFALLYQLLLVYDALQHQNTIQILGLVIMNLGLLIYGAVQIDTIQDVVIVEYDQGDIDIAVWFNVRPILIAIPCVLSISTVALFFVAWKLWDEFAWTILRLVSADLTMRQRYLNYQIYLVLLKFGFFYYMGFIIQFTVIVRGRTNAEFGLTIAAMPVTIITLLMAVYFMKHEIMVGMVAVIGLFFGGLAFFAFKLTILFQPSREMQYIAARKELTVFAVLTILVLLITTVYACLCMSAFGKGLKHFVNKPIVDDDLDSHVQPESVVFSGSSYQSEQNIQMVSNLRARLGGYQPASSG